MPLFHRRKPFGLFSLMELCLLVVTLSACTGDPAPSPALTATATAPAPAATSSPPPTPTITPQLSPTPVQTGDKDHEEPYLLDDFETEALYSGEDPYGIGIGFVTWGDESASVAADILQVGEGDALALPLQSGDNRVLRLNGTVPDWGGVTHNFEGVSGDVWSPMDWSSWLGVTFWVYGAETGSELLFEIQENRNPGSMVNDVEVWSYSFRDNFSGWKQYFVSWDHFSRKDIGNGAPRDGFDRTEVHGWAFGVVDPSPDGVTYYLDNVALYGEIAGLERVDVTFDAGVLFATEGDLVNVKVKLTHATNAPVTLTYAVQNSQAVEVKDFEPLPGTMTFEPTQIYQTFDLMLVDDAKPEETEALYIFITGVEGASLGQLTSLLVLVEDNDPVDETMLMDIEADYTFDVRGTDLVDIWDLGADELLALPDQVGLEGVLAVNAGEAEVTLTQRYGEPQDWSAGSGLSFWYYGKDTGETITVQLRNNPGFTTSELNPVNWMLEWEDEFDGPVGFAPDPGRWEPELGDGLTMDMFGWGNNELQYYTAAPENLALDGEGHLVITVQELAPESDLVCWYGSCEYTSARLKTQDRLEFTYGRVEASMKLTEGAGLWPAFWMMGNDSDTAFWPNSGELDIMEFIGREPGTIYGTAHGPGYAGEEGLGGSVDLGMDLSADFHEYAVEWERDEINWFVDDQLYATVRKEDVPGEWVFDHPFYLLLNLAVGGNWPGSPDEATVFPQTLVVDYVRVYGAGETYERFESSFTDDFLGWREVTLPFADFVRSGKQPWGSPDDVLGLAEIYGFTLTLPARDQMYYLDQFRLNE